MPKIQQYRNHRGQIFSALFTFDKGEVFPVHVHPLEQEHTSAILSGSFRCTGNPEIEGRIISQGEVWEWPVGLPHGFEALEDNSKMLQILKMLQ